MTNKKPLTRFEQDKEDLLCMLNFGRITAEEYKSRLEKLERENNN